MIQQKGADLCFLMRGQLAAGIQGTLLIQQRQQPFQPHRRKHLCQRQPLIALVREKAAEVIRLPRFGQQLDAGRTRPWHIDEVRAFLRIQKCIDLTQDVAVPCQKQQLIQPQPPALFLQILTIADR